MPDQNIPKPSASFRGPSQETPGNAEEAAAKWALPGLLLNILSQVSFYALRLIHKGNRKAYSADELGELYAELDDDGRISPSAIPNTLKVDALQLTDRSDVVLDSGVIGVNEFGDVIRGDGATSGGLEVANGSNRMRIFSVVHVPTATVTGGSTKQRLGVFRLRANEWVLGQRAIIKGEVKGVCSSTYAGTAYVGIRPTSATGDGYRHTSGFFGANGASAQLTFMSFVEFKAATSGTRICVTADEVAQTVIGTKVTYDAATVANVVAASVSTTSPNPLINTNGAEPGADTELEIYISLPQDAGFTGYVRMYAFLELELL